VAVVVAVLAPDRPGGHGGSGALGVAALVAGTTADGLRLLAACLTVATVLHVLMLLLDYGGRHATRHATVAAHLVTRGRYARQFWSGSVALACGAAVVAAIGWAATASVPLAVAGLAVQAALLIYESVFIRAGFIRAGQDVPLS
jgi:hypothetical protein